MIKYKIFTGGFAMFKKGIVSTFVFAVVFLFFSNLSATPLLDYTETLSGTDYQYDFTLTNDDIATIDELYIEFNTVDPFVDFISATSPSEWDFFDGPGQDISPSNNYWVGWTANFGNELEVLQDLQGFSITTVTQISNFDFSWNWDRFNISVGSLASNNAPVPEPTTMLLFGTGLVGLFGARLRKK
jgi:hypothetical protein